MMPFESLPSVWIAPRLATVTISAVPPLEPEPPNETAAVPLVERLPAIAKPPLPPPPPIDCAAMPSACEPSVWIVPVLLTLTAMALPPPLPEPPKPADASEARTRRGRDREPAVAAAAADRLRLDAVGESPLPSAPVWMLPTLTTVTVPASKPVPALPPKPTAMAGPLPSRAGNAEAAVAAAAADRLRRDTVRPRAVRLNDACRSRLTETLSASPPPAPLPPKPRLDAAARAECCRRC